MWTRATEESAAAGPRPRSRRQTRQFPSQQAEASCFLQTWTAEGVRPDRQVLFLHGALSHGLRHAEMFEWMVAESRGRLQIHALDLVGHGQSTGPRAHVERFSVYEHDLLQALVLVGESGLPCALMAHSLGGLVALKTLLGHENALPFIPKALVLTNPCVRPHRVVDFPRADDLLEGFSERVPLLRFPRVHKGRDMVINPVAANQFETDPLVPKYMTARMVRELWYAAEQVRALSYFLKVPTLFLVSEQDAVVDRQATLLFARGIDKRWSEVIEYENAKHELLHEAIGPRVWRDALAWLDRRMETP